MEILILHMMPALVHYMIKNAFTGTIKLTPGLNTGINEACNAVLTQL
jgi:hypothetical protein